LKDFADGERRRLTGLETTSRGRQERLEDGRWRNTGRCRPHRKKEQKTKGCEKQPDENPTRRMHAKAGCHDLTHSPAAQCFDEPSVCQHSSGGRPSFSPRDELWGLGDSSPPCKSGNGACPRILRTEEPPTRDRCRAGGPGPPRSDVRS